MDHPVKETLDRYYTALKSGDEAALADVLDDGIEVSYPAPDAVLPWSGLWQGLEGFKTFLKTVSDHVTIDDVNIIETLFVDDKAIVILNGRWTSRETGDKISAKVVNIFTISGGKISRYEVFNDTAAFGLGLGSLARS